MQIKPRLILCTRPPVRSEEPLARTDGGEHDFQYWFWATLLAPDARPSYGDAIAVLTFDYGGTIINGLDHRTKYQDREGNEHERNHLQEAAIIATLSQRGLRHARKYNLPEETLPFDLPLVNPRRDWLRFVENELHQLTVEGFVITVDPSFPFKVAQAGRWTVMLEQVEQWQFSVSVQVLVDDKDYSLLDLLFEHARTRSGGVSCVLEPLEVDDRIYLRLPDGRYVGLNAERVKCIFHILHELVDNVGNHYGREKAGNICSLAQALALIRLNCMSDVLFRGEPVDFLQNMANAVTTTESLLENSAGDSEKVIEHWLDVLQQFGIGGILTRQIANGFPEKVCIGRILKHAKGNRRGAARSDRSKGGEDDVREQKQAPKKHSHQIESIRRLTQHGEELCEASANESTKEATYNKPVGKQRMPAGDRAAAVSAPALIVCPNERRLEWLKHCNNEKLSVIELLPGDSEPDAITIMSSDALIVGYSLLTRRVHCLQQINWQVLIVDQPDTIESRNAQTVLAIKLMTAKYRLTILDERWQNKMEKLWIHFEVVMPGVFGFPRQFNQLLLKSDKSQWRRTLFIEILQPFLLGARDIFSKQPEQKSKWAGNMRGRDISMIMDVLLTNTPTKVIAAKHELKNTGSVTSTVHRFCYRAMMKRGEAKWDEWRKNRRNRTEDERRELMQLLMEVFNATQADFDG